MTEGLHGPLAPRARVTIPQGETDMRHPRILLIILVLAVGPAIASAQEHGDHAMQESGASSTAETRAIKG